MNLPPDGSRKAWHKALTQLAAEHPRRAAQREVLKGIWQEMIDTFKAAGYNKKQHGEALPFEEFLAREINLAGRDPIHAKVKCHDPDEVWHSAGPRRISVLHYVRTEHN